jgi:signal transduction histidine kinase
LILAGGRQLLELIQDILDLSMIESGELELRFDHTDLAGFVDELVELHQGQVRERGIELRSQTRGSIPPVLCDRRRVGQVLTNLLSNAIKFTEQGSVTVGVEHDAELGTVVISIADTGVGIDPEEIDAIFEEYRQVGQRKRKIRGTGLGLAIARRIAEAHGGTLDATSELGSGSTFFLRLPIEPDITITAPHQQPRRGAESAADRGGGR